MHFLNLRKNNLRVIAGTTFVNSMKKNKTLRYLSLHKNSINLNFLEKIAQYIESNNSLKNMDHVSELTK